MMASSSSRSLSTLWKRMAFWTITAAFAARMVSSRMSFSLNAETCLPLTSTAPTSLSWARIGATSHGRLFQGPVQVTTRPSTDWRGQQALSASWLVSSTLRAQSGQLLVGEAVRRELGNEGPVRLRQEQRAPLRVEEHGDGPG